jgi:hypothetical protein
VSQAAGILDEIDTTGTESLLPGIAISITLIAAALLVVAGVHTARTPSAVIGALAAQGLKIAPGVARGFGAGQVVVGAAVFGGSRAAVAATGVMYGAFAVFVARAVRRQTSCGCLGNTGTPARPRHAVLDAAFAGGSFTAVAVDVPSIGPIAAIGFLTLVAVGAFLAAELVGGVAPRTEGAVG